MICGEFSNSYISGDVDLVALRTFVRPVRSVTAGTPLTTTRFFSRMPWKTLGTHYENIKKTIGM